jgi:hypothetical protein
MNIGRPNKASRSLNPSKTQKNQPLNPDRSKAARKTTMPDMRGLCEVPR